MEVCMKISYIVEGSLLRCRFAWCPVRRRWANRREFILLHCTSLNLLHHRMNPLCTYMAGWNPNRKRRKSSLIHWHQLWECCCTRFHSLVLYCITVLYCTLLYCQCITVTKCIWPFFRVFKTLQTVLLQVHFFFVGMIMENLAHYIILRLSLPSMFSRYFTVLPFLNFTCIFIN